MYMQHKGALGFGYGPCLSTERKSRLEDLAADTGLECRQDKCAHTVWQNAKSQTRRIRRPTAATSFLSAVGKGR